MKVLGFGCVIFLFLLLILCMLKSSPIESFTEVLGAKAPHRHAYAECLRSCERSSPARSMGTSHLACNHACGLEIEKKVDSETPPTFPTDICFENCLKFPTRIEQRECRSKCSCAKNVNEWCAELKCPFSSDPDCSDKCFRTMKGHCSSNSWGWLSE